MTKERIIEYDIIRIFAMLLVVACHSFGNTAEASPSLISILSYLEMPCNGLFFAVSGALLLPVEPTCSSFSFVIKRIKRVAIPTIIWSIVYLLLDNNISTTAILNIALYPKGAGILWFMYVIMGLYIVAPVISPWLKQSDRKTLQFYIGLWALSLCYPILKNWLFVDTSMDGILYYVSGYLGFFVLGYYLKEYGISMKFSTIAYVIAFCSFILVKLFMPNVKLYDEFWYTTIFCAISVVFFWNLLFTIFIITKLSEGAKRTIVTISNLTFGIYFTHYIIVEYINPHLDILTIQPYIVGYILRIIIAFIGATITSFIISYLPFSNYIIGYRNKQ